MGLDKDVAVLGAGSFIGRHFARLLLKRGFGVSTYSTRIGTFDPRIRQTAGDYSASSLEDFLIKTNPAKIFFFAWKGVESEVHDTNVQWENLQLLENLLKVFPAENERHLVALGSQAEFGEIAGEIREDSELRPTTSYGKAKVEARAMLRDWARQTGHKTTWARVFSTYGADDRRPWLINLMARNALIGNKEIVKFPQKFWDYLHVEDAADAILAAGITGEAGDFNIASADPVRLGEVENLIRRTAGASERTYNYDDLPALPGLFVRETRLSSLYGWSPAISLEDGVRELLASQI